MGKRILRPAQSQAKLGIGHTLYYEWRKSGRLKPPLELGPKAVGDLESDIDAVIDELAAERDAKIQRNAAVRTGKARTKRGGER